MSKVMSIKFDVPPPEPNPFPVPMYTMPISTISSSSDASSPTLPPSTAPAPFCDDNEMIQRVMILRDQKKTQDQGKVKKSCCSCCLLVVVISMSFIYF